MSEHWEQYYAEIDGEPASIIYDHGLAKTIDQLSGVKLLWAQFEMRHTNEDGLAGDEEWDTIDAIEEAIDLWAQETGGAYAGSITTCGARFIHVYTPVHEEKIRMLLGDLEVAHDREFAFLLKDDPEKDTYWDELHPDPEQWRILNDSKVIHNLIEQGDTLTEPREVTHYLYFTHRELADECARRADRQNRGYKPGEILEPTAELPRFSLAIHQEIVPTLDEVSRHTLYFEEKASELGGEYDGWETFVVLEDDSDSGEEE